MYPWFHENNWCTPTWCTLIYYRLQSTLSTEETILREPDVDFNFTNFSSTKKMKSIIGTFFKILLPFKNKNYFILDNLLKYGHITLKFVGRYFHWVVAIYFPKNRTILVQNWRKKKIVKISFRLFKDWYNPMTIKPEGRGGG